MQQHKHSIKENTMAIKRLVSVEERDKRQKVKKEKKKNKTKSWSSLNDTQKFDVMGDYLISAGFVEA